MATKLSKQAIQAAIYAANAWDYERDITKLWHEDVDLHLDICSADRRCMPPNKAKHLKGG